MTEAVALTAVLGEIAEAAHRLAAVRLSDWTSLANAERHLEDLSADLAEQMRPAGQHTLQEYLAADRLLRGIVSLAAQEAEERITA